MIGKNRAARAALIADIADHLDDGRHVLLTGPRGAGKSWLLGHVAQTTKRAFYIPSISSKKAVLIEICKRLWHDGRLEDFAYFSVWRDVDKRLRHRTLDELKTIVEPHLASYRLVVDNLELASEKAVLDIIEPLMVAPTLAAADVSKAARKRRVALISDRFVQIELPPLSSLESRAMLWDLLDRSQYRHWQAIETKVLGLAQGQPGVIADLAEQMRGSAGSLADVRELSHSITEQRRVNLLAPTLIGVIALLMASRYLARGLDDPTAYLLAAVAYALSMAFRPLLWRLAG